MRSRADAPKSGAPLNANVLPSLRSGRMRELSSELLVSPPLRSGENQEFEQSPFGALLNSRIRRLARGPWSEQGKDSARRLWRVLPMAWDSRVLGKYRRGPHRARWHVWPQA